MGDRLHPLGRRVGHLDPDPAEIERAVAVRASRDLDVLNGVADGLSHCHELGVVAGGDIPDEAVADGGRLLAVGLGDAEDRQPLEAPDDPVIVTLLGVDVWRGLPVSGSRPL